jgi:hypothetical protein
VGIERKETEMRLYGIDVLRDFTTIRDDEFKDSGNPTRPWKTEDTAATFETALDLADIFEAEGALVRVWYNGDEVYKAGDFSKIDS